MPYFLTAEHLIDKKKGDGPRIDESSIQRPTFAGAQTSGWTVAEPAPVQNGAWPAAETVDMPGVECKPILLQAREGRPRDWELVHHYLTPQCSAYREQVWAVVHHAHSGLETVWVRVDQLGWEDILSLIHI